MRAIIIQESDAANLLDLLKLEKFGDPQMWQNHAVWQAIPKQTREALLSDMHHKFHFIVCRWLQEQGASCVR